MFFRLFYERGWQGGVLKVMKNDHSFNVFSPLGLFLKLYEMIRMPRLVACPIVFILLCDQNGQGGVFKVMKKDHFLVFLTVCFLFPKFFARLRSSLY